ncbi:MAG: Fic family protein [Oscillospiraceae bacterium]|nr:Fic family protein [Oscillospiraceae bacterium]
MREFNYETVCEKLLTGKIVTLLTQIHEYKGKQGLLGQAKSDVLDRLVEMAKIQSTEASNRIEGIFTSDERLKLLVKEKTMPRTRDEQEIAGYRDVLATIHESHEYIPPKTGIFLQLHRDMYKFSGKNIGGVYKATNNLIEEVDGEGNSFIRFQPVEAWETADAMEKICVAFDKAVSKQAELLLVIPAFIQDFLCIHPFSDGNGRMSRLLTLLLLYRAGYIVGKYISIEKLIEQSKETYYEALYDSSRDWHGGANDYAPFVRYTLGVILAAYRDFVSRIELFSENKIPKPEMVKEVIKNTLGRITKREILEQCPDISQITVQRTLNDLLKSSDIIKLGGGRYTQYIWNREKD